jgi:hypothetical protein
MTSVSNDPDLQTRTIGYDPIIERMGPADCARVTNDCMHAVCALKESNDLMKLQRAGTYVAMSRMLSAC